MKKLAAKNKIIIAAIMWVITSAFMLMYGFDILSRGNQQLIFKIEESKKELAALLEEKNSYNQAQRDLEQLEQEQLQPEDFFSKDVTLVNELKFLEDLEESLNVELSVSGVSGTSRTAGKAKTTSDMASVPYSISASGQFQNVLDLIQTMENLPFVSSLNSLAITVGEKGSVNLSMTANFYLRRN